MVAGLLLLDRLVVELHRGGCEKITLGGRRGYPELKRAEALGIGVETCLSMPAIQKPTLVLQGDVFVQRNDIARLIGEGGSLRGNFGEALPIAVLESGTPDAVKTMSPAATSNRPKGVAMRVRSTVEAKEASARLWDTITSSTDGFVDAFFNRPVGRLLSKFLVSTFVTPNQISVFATLLGVLSGLLFAVGEYVPALVAAVLLQISAVIDCVDGDVARVAYKESVLGKWLDIVGDQVVHVTVFVGVGVGLSRAGFEGPALALGISAGIGVIVSFAVILRGMSPQHRHNHRMQELIDKTTNRDFSVLLLFLAAGNHLWLFLWMVGIGVHVFWLIALTVQLTGGRKAATA